MHRMTRQVETAEIMAPFAGESVTVGEDRATLESKNGARYVRLDLSDGRRLVYRVTRVLGGHHREDFVGVPVTSAAADARSDEGDEWVLPVSYLIEKKRVRYKGYSVMVKARDHLAAGPIWNRTCPFCHNTVPLLSTLLASLAGPRPPHYQGEMVDALLPDDRRASYRVTDPAALDRALAREVARLDRPLEGSGPSAVRSAIEATRDGFTGAKLIEVGIGCEACHGGCREHVRDPTVLPSLVARAPYLRVEAAEGGKPLTKADQEERECARCHQVLFSRYPWTWEGGRRSGSPGGSHINSGEARDMLLGGCRGALRCTACHDPHASDEAKHLEDLATPAGNEVCLSCHEALRPAGALRRHSHHDPAGAAGACLSCHMPKKNMALTGRLTRYHRVGSPTDPARVLLDRPIECAVCHVDKSVESLVRTMEGWWNRSYSRDVLRSLYGDLGQPALVATLRLGKPHEKAVALSLLGRARDRDAAPLFAAELANEYPLVREYAADALRSTLGDACDIDLSQGGESLREALARCSGAAGFDVAPKRAVGRPDHGDAPAED